MGEVTNPELQQMMRCNEALRVLLHLHEVVLARDKCRTPLRRDEPAEMVSSVVSRHCPISVSLGHTCTCAFSTSNRGIDRPPDVDNQDVPEPLEGAAGDIRYRRLTAAVKLLKEDLDAEKRKAAHYRSRRCCADLLRFLLFLSGICAIIALYPPC